MRRTFITALQNRISALGVALTTASACLFLFLIGLEALGRLENPYAGIVVFVMMPALFVLGLVLIPIGLWIEKRRTARGAPAPSWPRLDLNDPAIRGTVFFVVAATLVNLAIVATASYGAVEYTESQAFCGQACHRVMAPEFVAHRVGHHGNVHCVACHVGPGAGGFVTAKLKGTRQLQLTLAGQFSRPIPTPLDNIPDVRSSCEQCHQPQRFIGDVIKTIYEHADDAVNTPSKTTLRLHVGGPISGTGSGTGIHWHMNRANEIEYVASDEKREQIPYVRVATTDGRVREYFAEGTTEQAVAGKPRRRMGCLDCHNRPAHRFGTTPEREVDAALGEGLISAKIPFVRREAVRALKMEYASEDAALGGIDRAIRDAMTAHAPHAFEEVGSPARDRSDAGHLPAQRVSVDEDRVGHIRESHRPYHLVRLFSMSRRDTQNARRPGDSPGLRVVSCDRVVSRHRRHLNPRKPTGRVIYEQTPWVGRERARAARCVTS